MKLLDIRNNLAKISYNDDEDIALGRFLALVDNNHSYVAQIVNLKAEANCNFAVAKLLFTFNEEGIVDSYDGTIPTLKAELSYINSRDILALLPIENPIVFGQLTQQEETLRLDETIFEKKLLICAEKDENISILVNNAVAQLGKNNEKMVVIDTDNTFADFKSISIKRDFKLPLNSKMIDYIYENDLEDVEPTSKAIIQDIFHEVQEYTNTIQNNFIPFDKFLNVVTTQYEETKIPELALLKNKLLKYKEENLFAEKIEDVTSLKTYISQNSLIYIDIHDIPDSLQKELITYIHNLLNTFENYIYNFVKLTNDNSNKKLLKQLLNNEKVFTSIVCSHNYKYVTELKQHAENIILFAPQTVQHDFASYNTFLSKLTPNEYIVYGNLTQNIPFMVELAELSQEELEEDYEAEMIGPVIGEQSSSIEEVENANPEEVYPIIENIPSTEDVPQIQEEVSIQEPIEETLEIIEDTAIDDLTVVNVNDNFEEGISNQVTNDVDQINYTNNIEEIASIEEMTQTSEETLTEADLDFIQELPTEENNLSDTVTPEDVIIKEPPEEFNELQPNIEIENQNDNIEIEENPITDITIPMGDIDLSEINESEESKIEQAEEITTYNLSEETIEEESIDDLPEYTNEELPIYPTEDEPTEILDFKQGDAVTHPKYGAGRIEKLIKYGNKTLCSIAFEQVGRRLLDPAISELTKISDEAH